MAYGDKRDYPKIDIYVRPSGGKYVYVASTTWAKTCSEAAQQYAVKNGYAVHNVKANFSK